jgi:hypothetical protein
MIEVGPTAWCIRGAVYLNAAARLRGQPQGHLLFPRVPFARPPDGGDGMCFNRLTIRRMLRNVSPV